MPKRPSGAHAAPRSTGSPEDAEREQGAGPEAPEDDPPAPPGAEAPTSPAGEPRAAGEATGGAGSNAARPKPARKQRRAATTKARSTPRATGRARARKTTPRGSPRRAPVRDPFDERLRSLEREIEEALQEVGGEAPGSALALQRAGEQLLAVYADLARSLAEGGLEAAFVRLRMFGTADAVDEFGFDALFYEQAAPLLRFLHDRWWRVVSTGLRNVPRAGRVMLVANRSGGPMPYDGLMIAHALGARRGGRGRAARPLVEDDAYHFPFAGSPLARLGVVRASAANGERLLAGEHAIVVFPEGAKGARKYYRDRYRLQRFARGGFVSLALRTGTPVVPVAVVGAEEIYPVLLRLQWLARVLGLPDFPVTPTFPLLGVLGLVPLPTKWRIAFGTPMDLAGKYGAEAYDDELLVNRVKESVRDRVQRMLIDALRERDSVFTG